MILQILFSVLLFPVLLCKALLMISLCVSLRLFFMPCCSVYFSFYSITLHTVLHQENDAVNKIKGCPISDSPFSAAFHATIIFLFSCSYPSTYFSINLITIVAHSALFTLSPGRKLLRPVKCSCFFYIIPVDRAEIIFHRNHVEAHAFPFRS